MLMGSFSSCIETTKNEVHKLLEERISDANQLIYKLEARLNQWKKSQQINMKPN